MLSVNNTNHCTTFWSNTCFWVRSTQVQTLRLVALTSTILKPRLVLLFLSDLGMRSTKETLLQIAIACTYIISSNCINCIPILERFSCVQGTLCGYFQKKQCAGPVAPWVWRHLRRAFNFDSMIVVLRLHPGPCCLARAPGAEHCPFDWGGAFTFCFFVACLCFPLLFSYLFAPRFFSALRPSLPRERNHAVSHPCGPKFVTFKS